ncbi:unnamed protein product [Paramecium octaurelia]|uniref:Ubiquitin-like protease family profile domain-containing protein n=1 Tax=Paramecium octaurelia TaxID=43137 RepID=A0A8S1Y948_PAROT|nr:unnamed protein product [Paramecium octaurelia]
MSIFLLINQYMRNFQLMRIYCFISTHSLNFKNVQIQNSIIQQMENYILLNLIRMGTQNLKFKKAHLGFAQVKKNSYQMAMEKSFLANLTLLNFKDNLKMAFLRMMQEIKDQKAPQTKRLKQSMFKQVYNWCKYNQQISIKDIQILENNRRLTSSIIDAYVLYLNLESEKDYFSKNRKNRQNINRILFLPTTLTTNFGRNYTDQHTKNIYEAELLQFQDLNYDLKKIYTYIGMPVNKNNYHWYFLLFDLKQNSCTVFDSLQKPTNQMNVDQQLILALEKLLKIKQLKKQFSNFSGQQTDGYSCGYHVCQFMNYCKTIQFEPKVNYDFKLNEIKKKLLTIIKK